MLFSTKSKCHKSKFRISWMYRYSLYDLKVHFWCPNKCLVSLRSSWNTLYNISRSKNGVENYKPRLIMARIHYPILIHTPKPKSCLLLHSYVLTFSGILFFPPFILLHKLFPTLYPLVIKHNNMIPVAITIKTTYWAIYCLFQKIENSRWYHELVI